MLRMLALKHMILCVITFCIKFAKTSAARIRIRYCVSDRPRIIFFGGGCASRLEGRGFLNAADPQLRGITDFPRAISRPKKPTGGARNTSARCTILAVISAEIDILQSRTGPGFIYLRELPRRRKSRRVERRAKSSCRDNPSD